MPQWILQLPAFTAFFVVVVVLARLILNYRLARMEERELSAKRAGTAWPQWERPCITISPYPQGTEQMRIFQGVRTLADAIGAGLLNFSTFARQIVQDTTRFTDEIYRAFPSASLTVKNQIARWIESAAQGARMFGGIFGAPLAKDYPTNPQLPELVNYRINVVAEFALDQPTAAGETVGYSVIPIDFAERPTSVDAVSDAVAQEIEYLLASGQGNDTPGIGLQNFQGFTIASIERRGR